MKFFRFKLRQLFYRLIPYKYTIFIPAQKISWLGIAYSELFLKFQYKRIRVLKLEDYADSYTLDAHDINSNIIQDSILYVTAILEEKLPSELNDTEIRFKHEIVEEIKLKYQSLFVAFKEIKPRLVVLMQGYEPLNAAARAVAIKLNIPVLALENTARSDRFLWDNVSGITTNKSLAKNYYWRYKDSVSPNVLKSYRQEYIKSIKSRKSAEHTSPGKKISFDVNEKPTVLFIGQVYTDSSVIFGICEWGTPIHVIESTIKWSKDNGYRVIIKLHPKEINIVTPISQKTYNKLTYRKMLESDYIKTKLDDPEIIVDHNNEYDTYDLIQKSSIVVTINSQAGLETLQFEKPVIVCGSAFYDGLGFTIDAHDPAFFEAAMNKARLYNVPSSAMEFNYIYYEKYCKNKNIEGILELIGSTL